MRWLWIDRFVEFQSGRRARAVKNVALAENHLDDYFPGYPVMAHSLIVEGLAQAGGLLVGELSGFEKRVVLAKVSRAKFYDSPRPGDTLLYTALLEGFHDDGAFVKGTSHIGQRLQAEIDLYFGYLADSTFDRELFEPAGFMRLLRIFGLYDVGVDGEGTPLKIPPRLLAAERRQLAT
jgi:3-hydroxyacyl-[acyl-carrier-protein] dehydratase